MEFEKIQKLEIELQIMKNRNNELVSKVDKIQKEENSMRQISWRTLQETKEMLQSVQRDLGLERLQKIRVEAKVLKLETLLQTERKLWEDEMNQRKTQNQMKDRWTIDKQTLEDQLSQFKIENDLIKSELEKEQLESKTRLEKYHDSEKGVMDMVNKMNEKNKNLQRLNRTFSEMLKERDELRNLLKKKDQELGEMGLIRTELDRLRNKERDLLEMTRNKETEINREIREKISISNEKENLARQVQQLSAQIEEQNRQISFLIQKPEKVTRERTSIGSPRKKIFQGRKHIQMNPPSTDNYSNRQVTSNRVNNSKPPLGSVSKISLNHLASSPNAGKNSLKYSVTQNLTASPASYFKLKSSRNSEYQNSFNRNSRSLSSNVVRRITLADRSKLNPQSKVSYHSGNKLAVRGRQRVSSEDPKRIPHRNYLPKQGCSVHPNGNIYSQRAANNKPNQVIGQVVRSENSEPQKQILKGQQARMSDYYYMNTKDKAPETTMPKISKVDDLLKRIKHNIETNNIPKSEEGTNDKYIVSELTSFGHSQPQTLDSSCVQMHEPLKFYRVQTPSSGTLPHLIPEHSKTKLAKQSSVQDNLSQRYTQKKLPSNLSRKKHYSKNTKHYSSSLRENLVQPKPKFILEAESGFISDEDIQHMRSEDFEETEMDFVDKNNKQINDEFENFRNRIVYGGNDQPNPQSVFSRREQEASRIPKQEDYSNSLNQFYQKNQMRVVNGGTFARKCNR